MRAFLYDAYCDTPKPLRLLGSIRPYVCPFDVLARYVPRGAHVLDYGCGPGFLLVFLAATSQIAEGIGCDLAAPPLQSARDAARRVGAENRLAFSHIKSLEDAPQGRFDAVTMVDVLHHVPVAQRPSIFAAAAERVAPGGVFIYKDMATRPRWRRLAHNLDDYLFTRQWVEQVPDGAVETWADASGLVLEHAEHIPRLVYGNERRVVRRPQSPIAPASAPQAKVAL